MTLVGESERKGRKTTKCACEASCPEGDWIIALRGSSGKPHASELPSPGCEGAGVFIHQFQIVFGRGLFPGTENSVALQVCYSLREQPFMVLGNEAFGLGDVNAGS